MGLRGVGVRGVFWGRKAGCEREDREGSRVWTPDEEGEWEIWDAVDGLRESRSCLSSLWRSADTRLLRRLGLRVKPLCVETNASSSLCRRFRASISGRLSALGGLGIDRSGSSLEKRGEKGDAASRRSMQLTISASFSVRGSLAGSLSGFSTSLLTLLRMLS